MVVAEGGGVTVEAEGVVIDEEGGDWGIRGALAFQNSLGLYLVRVPLRGKMGGGDGDGAGMGG